MQNILKGLKSQSGMAGVWLSSSPDKYNELSNTLSTLAAGRKCWARLVWNVPFLKIRLFPREIWPALHTVSECLCPLWEQLQLTWTFTKQRASGLSPQGRDLHYTASSAEYLFLLIAGQIENWHPHTCHFGFPLPKGLLVFLNWEKWQ